MITRSWLHDYASWLMNAGLRITLTDRRVVNEDGSFKSEQFYSEEGLREFVRFIESSREHLINDVIYLNSEKQGIPIEIAIMYNTGFSEKRSLLR